MCQSQKENPKVLPTGFCGPYALYRIQVPNQNPPRAALGYLSKAEKVGPEDVIAIEPDALRRALEGTGTVVFTMRVT